jgi:hypothetical protein
MSSRFQRIQRIWQRLQTSSHLRAWLGVGVLLFTFGFLAILLFHSREELNQFTDWQAYLGACIIGFLLYPLSLLLHSWIWTRMIGRLSRSTRGWWDIEIYAYTHLMRRLPGALWYLGARSLMYHERGIKANITLVASGLEWLYMLGGGVLVYGLVSLSGVSAWLLGLAAAGGLLILGHQAPRLIRFLAHWQSMPAPLQRWFRRLGDVALPTGEDLVLWLGAYVLTYGIAGAILFILLRSVASGALVGYGQATGVWGLTSSAGTLTVGLIPAGLGVRELTITALLSPQVPVVASVFVAVLIRLLFLAGDLVWGGLLWAVAHIAARSSSQ